VSLLVTAMRALSRLFPLECPRSTIADAIIGTQKHALRVRRASPILMQYCCEGSVAEHQLCQLRAVVTVMRPFLQLKAFLCCMH